MGLFRLFWIPQEAEPGMGAFVHYTADELLAILALESCRAQAFVVGEDLGTVEAGMREQLDAHRLLSYRLLWFESEPPSSYPARALAAVTTHDLPTIAGLWSGADLQTQHDLGLQPNAAGLQEIHQRLQKMTGLSATADIDTVVRCTHALLAEAPSAVIVATLEDALAVAERPNMPNTTAEWPNWSLALPCPLEAIEHHPLVHTVATALQGGEKPTK
jgi:4-alpha-glucanotransferase